MNIKRIAFWGSFIIVIGLIIWGLIVSMNRDITPRVSPVPPVSTSDNVKGPENAPVTIIEYSDFQCPACKYYYGLVNQALNEASSTIRLVYRHFPLSQHLNAEEAAQAAEAAGKQGKFWEMYDLLFKNQDAWSASRTVSTFFEKYATDLGLDMTQYKKDYESTEIKNKIRDQQNKGIEIGVGATPTFFINGKIINNPGSYEQFKKIIDDAARASSN